MSCWIFLLACGACPATAGAQNLIQNGFFASNVSNWNTPTQYAAAVPMTWKAGPDAIGAANSGYLRADAIAANQYRAGIRSNCMLTVGIDPQRLLRFQAYAKNLQGAVYSREVRFTAHKSGTCTAGVDDVTFSSKEYFNHSAVATEWKLFDRHFKFPAGTASFSAFGEIVCGTANGAQSACAVGFDHFLFQASLFDSGFE